MLNLLRQRLLVQPWYHWPTFVYLFRDGLQLNTSAFAGSFGRIYNSHYRRRFGFEPVVKAHSAPSLSQNSTS